MFEWILVLISHWLLIIWNTYTNLKTWSGEVYYLMKYRKNYLFVWMCKNGMSVIASKLYLMPRRKRTKWIISAGAAVRCDLYVKKLCSLKEFFWLVLIVVVYIIIA